MWYKFEKTFTVHQQHSTDAESLEEALSKYEKIKDLPIYFSKSSFKLTVTEMDDDEKIISTKVLAEW